MKNFLLKCDSSRYFSGSLASWKECGEATATACLPRPPMAGEAENSFELFSIYTASWKFASQGKPPRFARRLICIHFWAKKKDLSMKGKRNFFKII